MAYEKKRKPAPMNPWRLSHCECKALEMMVAHGCQSKAADALRRDRHTLATQIYRARDKMKVANTMLAVLEWDRAVRGGRIGEQAEAR